MTDERSRGPVLTALAILMGLLAVSNFSKPLGQAMQPESDAGFVFLGQRLEGVANTVMGPLFGLFLAIYAYGVWTRRRWVVPLAIAYAAYVVLNLLLFATTAPPAQVPGLAFMAVYTAIAIGVSAGGALYLYRNRQRLQ
ncbi:MAG: hypothetical protein ACREKH_18610 [Candidatus Rokuibacteriota bacterium]